MHSNLDQITDKELLHRYYEEGQTDLLGVLLQRYTLLLFGVGMKYLKDEEEAKDAVQQVFLKVLTELPRYRVEYFKSWLYTIAKNYCLMKLRDKGFLTQDLNEKMLWVTDDDDSKSWHYDKEKMLTIMTEAVEELADEQKRCIILFYLQKKSYQEIVSNTGFTLMKVKSYIQNGKRNLKIILQRSIEHER